jgi:hypothetical protein
MKAGINKKGSDFYQNLFFGRVDWIRTSDPLHPIQVRYRAAPPPESQNFSRF